MGIIGKRRVSDFSLEVSMTRKPDNGVKLFSGGRRLERF
jgi:hypothetical protein